MSSNFLRAREIKGIMKERGESAGTVWCLEVLAEQQIALQKDVRNLAAAIDQMANIITNFTHVAEGMKSTIEKLNSDFQEDGLSKNTQDPN